jgi:hypothetical protein
MVTLLPLGVLNEMFTFFLQKIKKNKKKKTPNQPTLRKISEPR